ncbi:MAG: permease-like cell division protein FtsX [Clostridia bacterium]|nr:permease-like cell division protein FtsX [Clostridia bacterium]
MKLSSLGYLIKEGFRNIKQNSFMSIASILVLISCLLLSGAAYLTFVNVENAFDWAYSQNVVVVWAAETADEAQVTALGESLKTIPNVNEVTFISKEQILQDYANVVPDATFESLQGENNPMLDAYEVTFTDLNLAQQTIDQIFALENVDDVSYYNEVAEVLVGIRNAVMKIGGVVILMLLAVSLFIISNTIKLTVYSRRLEIGIMKSVGATKAFIRLPFMVEGMVLGFSAGLLSFGILYFVYARLMTVVKIGQISFVSMNVAGLLAALPVWAELLIGFLVVGTLTGMLGSGISIGRYLKEESGVSID